ncbi:hypothetical protein AB0C61_37315 [Streptomyces sp. NPDC048680]|uniref:hypothetical protein n=1 Tax=Streptomyces sp. NPDC048680 TaxID=3155492 RepID=UPI00342897BD
MGRISEETRSQKEEAIRAAMDRLLRGELPPGGKCDLSTLAADAGVTRTAFYPKKNRDGTVRPGPYQHLADEFERRLKLLQDAGTVVDPRAAQIQRLKDLNASLENRLAKQNAELDELKEFQQLALSRIAAQHLEIERLRAEKAAGGKFATLLPRRPQATGTIGSCS